MMQQMPNNPMQMIQQFNQFRQSFSGDPKQAVMNLLKNGQMSQKQLDQLQKMAGQFQQIMNGMTKS